MLSLPHIFQTDGYILKIFCFKSDGHIINGQIKIAKFKNVLFFTLQIFI